MWYVRQDVGKLCASLQCFQYFTHERGTHMGVYALFLAGSNFFAPLISGFINDGQGWQWVLVSWTSLTFLT